MKTFYLFILAALLINMSVYAGWENMEFKTAALSNVHSESKSALDPKTFLGSTNIWIVVKSDNVSTYSHNRNYSIYLKNSAEAFLNGLSTNLGVTIPNDFYCKLFAFDSQNEMMKYLSETFSGIDVERWYENESLLTYRFSENKKLRKKVFRDDLPYLLTLSVLNKIDSKNGIPETLKIGFAVSTEQSVSNKLKKFRYDLLENNEKWLEYKTLFNTHFDAYDEPEFIDNIEGESALWAMFIRSKLSPQQTGKLIYNLADSVDMEKAFAKAFGVGMFDTMPRIEEQMRKWFNKEFPAKLKQTFYISKANRILIILSFAGLIVLVFLTILYKWIKDLIN
jgi:hypothetical protein